MAVVFIDVEENANTGYAAQAVFSSLEEPRPVRQVCLYDLIPAGMWYEVTGWTVEGRPCPAEGMAVEDSGQGRAWLVYGGDAGIRLRPAGSGSGWSLEANEQRGEPYLLLSEIGDVVWA